MADFTARLKPPPPDEVAAFDRAWRARFGDHAAPPDHSTLLRRVLCGAVFPAADRPDPCPQVLGTAVPAVVAPELWDVVDAIAYHDYLRDPRRPRPPRSPPSPDGVWLLAAHRGHFHRDPDGRYRLITERRLRDVPGRRRRTRSEEPSDGVAVGGLLGRRMVPIPMQAALRLSGHPAFAGENSRHARDVIGHCPLLPALVRCPRCGQFNRVEKPDHVRVVRTNDPDESSTRYAPTIDGP